ncbi:MAG: hypothetical protein IJT44_12680 [Clostridia bacterium]|nr:hypothetical protein [Clostridia bacterium]
MLQKILAVLLSLTTFALSLSASRNKVTAPADDSDFVPVLRFVIASDTHIKTVGDKRAKRIQKILSLAYSDAEQDKAYDKLDAAVFAGDLTNKGTLAQFLGFKGAVNSVLQPQTQHLAVVAKSHDGNTLGKKSLRLYEQLSGQSTDFHTVINGFHFIGLSASKTENEHYSEYQRTWLREQLDAAVLDDPQKPIFVTHHEHVSDTVYGSFDEDGWGIGYFKDIFSEYPQIIHFSGHSHYPLNDPRSIWQGAFTAVGTGAVYYAELTVDGENCVHPAYSDVIAQCWIVEVDAQNAVRLRGFDAISGKLLCEYTLHNVADKTAREYTSAQQQAAASAPAFDKAAAITVSKNKKGTVNIELPAAKATDGTIVFLYRMTAVDGAGKTVDEQTLVNDYWLADDYEKIAFTSSAPSGSTITVTAENAYGMQSEPVQVQIP